MEPLGRSIRCRGSAVRQSVVGDLRDLPELTSDQNGFGACQPLPHHRPLRLRTAHEDHWPI
eukprot:5050385-Alexandrium_andersonii.AAC.1